MNEPLSTDVILECLRGMGLSSIETSRDDSLGCWRIRAQGGPVVHIHDNGRVSITGLKAHSLRRELGLTGKRAAHIAQSE